MWRSARLVLTVATIALMVRSSLTAQEIGKGSAGDTAADAPVITVHGICPAGPASATAALPCVTRITRQQFESLTDALYTGGRPPSLAERQNLARTYAEYLAVEAAARNTGMEDTPQFRELMNWARLRTTTELYRRDLQAKSKTPSPEEIEAYYNEHHSDYETVRLMRILVPREHGNTKDKDLFETSAKAIAELVQPRASHGEDPAHIQKDVYEGLRMGPPPSVDLGERRRTELVPQEAKEIFSLKPGEVTKVLTEPKSYVIYKVLAKGVLGLEKVREEISREIYDQKFRKAMKALIDSAQTEFNEQYFSAGDDKTPH